MKLFIRILSFSSALILSCFIVLSPVKVEASSPDFNTDYSSVLDITQIQGIMGGLSSGALSALYNSLGGLAYSYLQSVNVDVKSNNLSTLLYDLGKDVYNYILHPADVLVDVGTRYVYDVLSSQSKYFLSSLFKKVDDNVITESNYTDYKYQWKAHVSLPMSDIFNTVSRYMSWTTDPDSFQSASNTIYSDLFTVPSSVILNNYPSVDISLSSSFVQSSSPSFCINYTNSYVQTPGLYLLPSDLTYDLTSFDSIIFFDNYSFSDTSSYVLVLDNNSYSFTPSNCVPLVFLDSSTGNFRIFSFPSGRTIWFYSSAFPYSSGFYPCIFYNFSYYSLINLKEIVFPIIFNGSYDFSSFSSFILGYSDSCSILSLGEYASSFCFTNVNAYVTSLTSNHIIDLASAVPYSSAPISIDIDNVYQGSLQLPIDNAPGEVASIDIQSVIDAINDNSITNNIDRLSDIIIDGVVGAIPTVSIDAWNPDRVTDLATSSDIALGLDSLAQLEDTVAVNVSPVFDTFPIVPFLKPIVDVLHSDVTSVIFVCIFIVVLFGFLNKLLF